MVDLARYDDRIRVHADMLDNQPYALNTPDGTIDLHTATLHPHQAADNHTKITGSATNPTNPPRWTRFLTETFNGDHAMIGCLQRILGYAATGAVTHHILPFLHGAGANGKTVLTDVLLAVLGDYAITLALPRPHRRQIQPRHRTRTPGRRPRRRLLQKSPKTANSTRER